MGKVIRERKVACADCSVMMRLRGKSRLHYWCPRCSASLIADQYGRPHGMPGTAEERRWRRSARTVFDRLWRSGNVTRSSAQRWLAGELGIPRAQCHFSGMRIEMLRESVRVCDAVHEGRRQGPRAVDDDPKTSERRRLANEAVKLFRQAGAHPIALRHWIAHHVGVASFVDVGGMSGDECERLIRLCDQSFHGRKKLPRGAKLDRKLKLRAIIMTRRMLQQIEGS